jgi:hypothetical protein
MSQSKINLSQLFGLAILIMSVISPRPDDNQPDRINGQNLDYYLKESRNEVKKQCNTEALSAYGLDADADSLSETNEVCPQVKSNCCGKKSQASMIKNWDNDRQRQERYYKVVMKVNKYILGYSGYYRNIALTILDAMAVKDDQERVNNKVKTAANNSVIDPGPEHSYTISPTKFCAKHAEIVRVQGFSERNKAEDFYDKLTTRLEFIQNTRRGFYCALCSSENKDFWIDYNFVTNIVYGDRIVFDKTFCYLIHNNIFDVTYEMSKNFRPYVASIMKMLTCINPKTKDGQKVAGAQGQKESKFKFNQRYQIDGSLQYPLENASDETKELFNNPIAQKKFWVIEFCNNSRPDDFTFFWFCESFCQNWHISKPTEMFDGNAAKSMDVYRYLSQYEFALDNREQNHFYSKMNDMTGEIKDNFRAIKRNDYFFTSTSRTAHFENFHTDFLTFGKGIHPYEDGDRTTLVFEYCSEVILKAFAAILAIHFIL